MDGLSVSTNLVLVVKVLLHVEEEAITMVVVGINQT
jgi:hypothetical protein